MGRLQREVSAPELRPFGATGASDLRLSESRHGRVTVPHCSLLFISATLHERRLMGNEVV